MTYINMKMVSILTGKFFLYLLMSIIVFWSMDSLNINGMFKKNKIYQARCFYYLIALSLIYLATNFVYDIYLNFL